MRQTTATTAVLAEDDFLVSREIARALKQAGCTVVATAPTGEKAVELTRDHRPDVVVMDIQMPKMDGMTSTKAIRDYGFDKVPIVAMTAHAMKGDREKCIDAGANEYLVKPVQLHQLNAIIQRLLMNG